MMRRKYPETIICNNIKEIGINKGRKGGWELDLMSQSNTREVYAGPQRGTSRFGQRTFIARFRVQQLIEFKENRRVLKRECLTTIICRNIKETNTNKGRKEAGNSA